MLKLGDFYHLPVLDAYIERLLAAPPGLLLVAGPGQPSTGQAGGFLPSGRGSIWSMLLEGLLTGQDGLHALVIAADKTAYRAPRGLARRVEYLLYDDERPAQEALKMTARRNPGLLAIDLLTPDLLPIALEFASRPGARLVAQVETVVWGEQVARLLGDWGAPDPAALRGVLSVQRFSRLCPHCKTPAAEPALARLHQRSPELVERLFPPGALMAFAQTVGCPRCQGSGRYADLMAFDVWFPGGQPGLTLEEYLLRLAGLGQLALDDALDLPANHLRRTANLLASAEQRLAAVTSDRARQLAEQEASRRVLLQRTEMLLALHEVGQGLIHTTELGDLADLVGRHARQLCGADRSVVYYLRTPEVMDIILCAGWGAARVQSPVSPSALPSQPNGAVQFKQLPPGVLPAPEQATLAASQAGLLLPLLAQDHLVGWMVIQSTQRSAFSPGQVSLLQTLATQAALAIERSSLIADLRAKIVQLQAAQIELVKKERMESELELARQVQQSVLPQRFPAVWGCAFAAYNRPARQVGGDFYDVFSLDNGRVGLVVADVSDKGLPAALFMTLTRSLLLAEARRSTSPRLALLAVNRLLLELGAGRMFVSVFYAVFEPSDRHLTYTRAGHDRPLLLRAGQALTLGGAGAVLGVLEEDDLRLSEERLELYPGDRLALYTDGLVDVVNERNEHFGLPALTELLSTHSTAPLEAFCPAVFRALAAHQGGREQFDDMTLLVMQFG